MSDKKFSALWHDNNISLERLANIYRTTPAAIVQRGRELNLNDKLNGRGCELCWFLSYCRTREAQRSDLLPCEGGEPTPYIEAGYPVYKSPVGQVFIRVE